MQDQIERLDRLDAVRELAGRRQIGVRVIVIGMLSYLCRDSRHAARVTRRLGTDAEFNELATRIWGSGGPAF